MTNSQRLKKSVVSDDPPHGRGRRRVLRETKDLEREEWARTLKMQGWIVPSVVGLVLAWLIFVGFIVVFDGMGVLDYHPSVLVTLLGSALPLLL